MDDATTQRNPDQLSTSPLEKQPSNNDELETIRKMIGAIAQGHEGDTLALLALLRTLEDVHGQIRDSLFQPSLPNNRQKLYALLRDMELEGGWPYIPRMKLKRLLANVIDSSDGITTGR